MLPTTIDGPSTLPELRTISTNDREMAELCQRVIPQCRSTWSGNDRRSQQRLPFPELIHLHPLTEDGKSYADQSIVSVVGKSLATLGLDFYHQRPIPYRYVVVDLPTGADRCMKFVLKIRWCRFLTSGWYDSGGRFVKVVEECDRDSFDPLLFSSLQPINLN